MKASHDRATLPLRLEAKRADGFEPCHAPLSLCLCALLKGHEGPHVCSCNGSWTGSDATDDVEIVRFPEMLDDGSPNVAGAALNTLLFSR